jgi:FlaA1/EpsC-like NDP-sugar epimerase
MRNRYIFLGDAAAFAFCAYGAFALRFDLLGPRNRPEFVPFLIACLVAKPVVFTVFGMYRRFWRYASVPDMIALAFAVTASSIVVAALIGAGTLTRDIFEFSRSVLVNDWLLTLLMTSGSRLSLRMIAETRSGLRAPNPDRRFKQVLVVGAGEAGAMVVREMHRNRQLRMKPVAFLDDDPMKIGKRIHGVPVVGATTDAEQVIATRGVNEVIIAMPTAPGVVLRRVTSTINKTNITSRTVPGVYELLGGQITVSRLRNIEISDLLRRAQLTADVSGHQYLTGSTVIVTGGGGSIGVELCRQVAHARPARLVVLGHGENSVFDAVNQLNATYPDLQVRPVIADIRDRPRMRQIFKDLHPDVVFHAAAHKHVPLMEENAPEAISNNVLGTRHVVESAIDAGAQRLVLVSTDKAVSPSSLMGASKRIAEMIVREAAQRTGRAFVAVRFGNVLGSRGSVVPIFNEQIQRGGPLRITHPDMKRFFMTIPEAVHLVMQAGGLGRGGELFVLRMGEPVRIVDLARDLIVLSGLEPDDVPIMFTGIRPGEKLQEDLWEVNAAVESTAHPDILRVNERRAAADGPVITESVLSRLADFAELNDRAGIEQVLSECLPTFVPSWMRRELATEGAPRNAAI